MNKVVLATGNKGKVVELAAMLAPFSLDVVTQSSLGVSDADETGLTFIENAILKARHAAAITGLPAIADDSGLAVAALAGAPGIYSARYAGQGASDQQNCEKLLSALTDVPPAQRQATFHCVLVYLSHAADPTPLVCHGQWQGEIALVARGEGGFGYDPIFYLADLNKTAAELSPDQKKQRSHRAQALQQLVKLMSLAQSNKAAT
ncbi:RdgB/HAM1 family non-canonical purine NTP pyrophosphatase [Alishewanella sp. SMS8]|uniref:RdgB/HAM1 family non-canonical purine NTP pyrophosphatase n=1 Tax=Alishewanella sp. SMS8 TaxID=2994676 RepID=UPI00274083DB|nr:RdgB/HAM1 family non-canonical purine NTP pyrophosphatase [Alishewanella sp. SMS8]MDP4945227.1 RdgB/HAM1 family non-canonical purine NTP pyrophosphatase [Alishewanella sp.]MDP5036450.1 RdgB/HAM1 family non-canonical purine NTP pyrophosphatase [Alishewanella sp.]MDP5187653.1 RdgB/HAM1 family non-canonical purine NTP pyrophosphatase [Alishewanella sp.]MDP5458300.1 RdgB/HAM1 family non-canonical purine NTP pyrophosphatase [Alishewanella sp. SMS8]